MAVQTKTHNESGKRRELKGALSGRIAGCGLEQTPLMWQAKAAQICVKEFALLHWATYTHTQHSEQHIHIRIPIHICLMPNAWPLIRAQSNKERKEGRRQKGGGSGSRELGGKIKMQNSFLFNIFDVAWLRPGSVSVSVSVSVFSLLYGNCPPDLDDKQPQGRK